MRLRIDGEGITGGAYKVWVDDELRLDVVSVSIFLDAQKTNTAALTYVLDALELAADVDGAP